MSNSGPAARRLTARSHGDVREKRLAFIFGVARSGTSAFVHTINSHPAVCMGMERYKHRLMRGEVQPGLFTRDRFFDFQAEDTNILPARATEYADLYADMDRRWDHADVVGDKVNQLFRVMGAMVAAIPRARYFYLLRSIDDVASSWNTRALHPRDKWPRENDFSRAVPEWNEANGIVLDLMERSPGSVAVVPYERFYAGDPALLRHLCEFIDLEVHSLLEQKYREQVLHYERVVRAKPRTVLPNQEALIRDHADFDAYRTLLGLAP